MRRVKKLNKIKRATLLINDTTLFLKSFKRMMEVIFYLFLMCYVGYDKIRVYSNTKVINKVEVDDASGIIEQVGDRGYDIDYIGIGVVGILFIMVVYKIIVMIKDRNE